MPFSEYLALEALHSSAFQYLKKSLAHYRYHADNDPKEPTPAMVFGSLVHTLLLEPEKMGEFIIAEEYDRRTKEGKALEAESKATKRPVVKVSTLEDAKILTGAIEAHPAARYFLEKLLPENKELSLFWGDGSSGCKARLDGWIPEMGTRIEIKTTGGEASAEGFGRDIFLRNYHLQSAMYSLGMEAITDEPILHHVFIVPEKEPPHAVAVFRLDDAVLHLAKKEVKGLISQYKRAKETNLWPGYPDSVQNVDIPAWAYNQMESVYGG